MWARRHTHYNWRYLQVFLTPPPSKFCKHLCLHTHNITTRPAAKDHELSLEHERRDFRVFWRQKNLLYVWLARKRGGAKCGVIGWHIPPVQHLCKKIYVCMYVHIHMCIYSKIHTDIHDSYHAYVIMNICIYVYIRVLTCLYINMHLCKYTYICVHLTYGYTY